MPTLDCGSKTAQTAQRTGLFVFLVVGEHAHLFVTGTIQEISMGLSYKSSGIDRLL